MKQPGDTLHFEVAKLLLPREGKIHVFFEKNGKSTEEVWERDVALQFLAQNEIIIASIEAREKQHGLCVKHEVNGWVFIQTRGN